jgi:ribonucleases P/MRP protein subunit RPP40
MQLNRDKCKIMTVGHHGGSLPSQTLDIAGLKLFRSSCERDLGIFVSDDLKWHEQSAFVANKANQMLSLIKRSFVSRDLGTLRMLYCGLIRPILDYAVPVWNPRSARDINMIERVQRRATKMQSECANMPYKDRLNVWQLQELSQRRIRGDLIQLFKCVKDIDKVEWTRPLTRKPSLELESPAGNTRGHNMKLAKESCRSNLRKWFFTNRTIPIWNKLPQCCVLVENVNEFKNHIDRHYFRQSAARTKCH